MLLVSTKQENKMIGDFLMKLGWTFLLAGGVSISIGLIVNTWY